MPHAAVVGLGIAAGVIQLAGNIPYVRDIFRGKTKPERATWWIWTLLNVVSLGAQIGAHATWSLLMTVGQGLMTAFIAVMSLHHGYGKFQRRDYISAVAAVLGVGLWWWLQSPLAAIIVVLLVDASGFWLTIAKTWRAPRTETLIAWQLTALSGGLGVLAVGRLDATQLLYPAYIMAGNTLMALVIVRRRHRNRRPR
ncbi:MAG TPA: hypothetical protein VLF71_03175 [Candidatus Saccharimonadales bacterium]|nr:hypothetical protein [Candidatus Saccharimonadales bacterium]